jgi:hypothetical protein
MSLRQFARLIGVTGPAVVKARRRGVFTVGAVGTDQRGAPVILDVHRAIADWERSGRRLRAGRPLAAPVGDVTTQPSTNDEPDDLPASSSLVDAQRLAMLERARKLKLENDLREGQLVEVAVAAKQGFEFSRTIRESILNLPARLSAELAAESDADRVYRRLDAALREALEATADMLDAQVDDPSSAAAAAALRAEDRSS